MKRVKCTVVFLYSLISLLSLTMISNAQFREFFSGKSSEDKPNVHIDSSSKNNLSGVWRLAVESIANSKWYWVITDNNGILTFKEYWFNDITLLAKMPPLLSNTYSIKGFHSDGKVTVDYMQTNEGIEDGPNKEIILTLSVRASIDSNGNIVGTKSGTSMVVQKNGRMKPIINIPTTEFFASRVNQIGD